MSKESPLPEWITGAELCRRIGISGAAVKRYADRVGVRRLIREGLPPLYHEKDVAAIAALSHVEGKGVANPDPLKISKVG